jgi:translation initiation factor 4E
VINQIFFLVCTCNRLYNNIIAPSQLAPGSNYHLFKDGVEPKWEDPANSKGGKWVVSISRSFRQTKLDNMWLWTILACIGEGFDGPEDSVCGVVVSIRKNQEDKISLWIKGGSSETIKAIG